MGELIHLDANSINNLSLPNLWQPLLVVLKHLEDRLEKPEDLFPNHLELLKAARTLLEADRHHQFQDQRPHLNEIFVEAVAQSTLLSRVVLGPRGLLDTAGSETLSHHASDADLLPKIDWKQFATSFQLSSEAIVRIEGRLQDCLVLAAQKSLVIESLLDDFKIRNHSGAAQKEQVLKAFQAFYPAVPLCAGEVELITSGTLWSFCIPFADGELLTPWHSQRTSEARDQISTFLKEIRRFKQDQFARFPAFGSFDFEKMDPVVIQSLMQKCKMDRATVKSLLSRMVSILPLQEVDKYIVHDLWGHGWQASLVPFDRHYQMMAGFSAPLSQAIELTPDLLNQAIVVKENEASLNTPRVESWIHSFLSARLPVALTPIFAEMLADVVEFKFLADHPDLLEKMPSSSPYKFFPTKIDLLMQDVPFYFGQATKPLRHLCTQPKHQESLTQLFAKTLSSDFGLSEDQSSRGGANLTQQVIAVWQALEAKFYKPKIEFRSEPSGHLVTNSYSKILLNFVSIHSTLVDLEQDLHLEHPILGDARHEINGNKFRDITVLATALYFVANPVAHLWSIDEYIALVLKSQCQQLAVLGNRDRFNVNK